MAWNTKNKKNKEKYYIISNNYATVTSFKNFSLKHFKNVILGPLGVFCQTLKTKAFPKEFYLMHQFVINNLKGMLKKVAFYDSAETENQTEFFYFFGKTCVKTWLVLSHVMDTMSGIFHKIWKKEVERNKSNPLLLLYQCFFINKLLRKNRIRISDTKKLYIN